AAGPRHHRSRWPPPGRRRAGRARLATKGPGLEASRSWSSSPEKGWRGWPEPPPPVSHRSAMRRRVHEPALGPEGVDTPGEAERRVHADVALEDLAVIADVLDDTGGEVGGQAETCIERGGAAVRLDRETEETPDLGVVGVSKAVDVGRGDTELFGDDRGDHDPVDHLSPLRVTVPNGRAKGLLGEGLVEDRQGLRAFRPRRPHTGQL